MVPQKVYFIIIYICYWSVQNGCPNAYSGNEGKSSHQKLCSVNWIQSCAEDFHFKVIICDDFRNHGMAAHEIITDQIFKASRSCNKIIATAFRNSKGISI